MVHTHVLYYSLPIQHISVPWVHTRDTLENKRDTLLVYTDRNTDRMHSNLTTRGV